MSKHEDILVFGAKGKHTYNSGVESASDGAEYTKQGEVLCREHKAERREKAQAQLSYHDTRICKHPKAEDRIRKAIGAGAQAGEDVF